MTDQPTFDPFAALAEAKRKNALSQGAKTLAELSQTRSDPISEQTERVSENFATFAALADRGRAHASSHSSPNIKKERDFIFSFQGLSHQEPGLVADRATAKPNASAQTPARPAILRGTEPSACTGKENLRRVLAKVSRDLKPRPPAILVAGPAPARDPKEPNADAGASFEERAAFLEYDCGLSRAEAEAQARAEDANVPGGNVRLSPAADTLAGWYVAIARLNPEQAPCPGYRVGEWTGVYSRVLAFLDRFGEQAETFGWTASRLFGVHVTAGIVRPDACGALVLPIGGEVRAITATEIRFGHLTHRQKPGQTVGVPWWEWSR